MSQNVETVRRVVAALGAGDYVRAACDFDPDAIWQNTDAFPGPTNCSGMAEMVVLRNWGTGSGSGAPIDLRWASIYRLREGRVVRVEVHGRYDRALKAAGLRD